MTVGKRLKIAIYTAIISAIIGSFVFLILSSGLRKLAIIALIATLAVFVISLVVTLILEGKPAKVRVPVFAAVILISVIVVLSLITYQIGLRILFRPGFNEDAYDELTDLKGGVQTIEIGDYSGWRIPASSVSPSEARPVILYFAGNGGDSSKMTLFILEHDELAFLHENYDFIYVDYPSYGNSGGVLSESSIKEFALEVYEGVSSLDTTSSVTVIAYSLGNGPAVYLTSQEEADIDNLILLAPYNSGYDLYNSSLNIFHGPLRLLVAYKMPVYSFASDVTCPVTIIASSDDEVVPIDSSRDLFSYFRVSSSSNFITVNGVDHDDFWDSEAVTSQIETILEG